jgi:hypothetical protein
MLEIVTNITDGKGTMADVHLLEELARAVKDSTMCGPGRTSPNPVLSTLNILGTNRKLMSNIRNLPPWSARGSFLHSVTIPAPSVRKQVFI